MIQVDNNTINDNPIFVRCIDELAPCYGLRGKIIRKIRDSICVEFDARFDDGHEGIGGKFGHCWFFTNDENVNEKLSIIKHPIRKPIDLENIF